MATPDTELAIVQNAGTQQLAEVDYSTLTDDKIKKIVEEAKSMGDKTAGLPTADSIDYFSIEDELKVGEKVRFTYLARTIEFRTDEETGEVKPTATVILVNSEGKFYKCATYNIVKHFATQASGYQAEVTYTGSRKSKKNRQRTIQTMEFRPLT